MLGLARDLVEVLGKRHAQAGRIDRAVDDLAEFPAVVDDRQDLLHAPEGEHRDQERAAPLDRVVDRCDETADLADALLAKRTLGGATGRFHDDGVEVTRREARAGKSALIFEKHVSGKEDRAVLVVDLDRGGAGDMAGRVKDDFDLVFLAAKLLGVTERQPGKTPADTVDLLMRE